MCLCDIMLTPTTLWPLHVSSTSHANTWASGAQDNHCSYKVCLIGIVYNPTQNHTVMSAHHRVQLQGHSLQTLLLHLKPADLNAC